MSGHMYLTSPRTAQPGDKAKASTIVADAKQAMAPYKDYRQALADGYHIFCRTYRSLSITSPAPKTDWPRESFRSTEAYFALYKKTPDGGYQLIGVMYTDRVNADEDELNERIPLSIARWHQHTNFCKAPEGQKAAYFGPNAKFGPARFDPHARRLRCGRRRLSPAYLRLDGPRVSV